MPTASAKNDLPEGVSALIALVRVAHRDGNRPLEQSARDRLARDYGMSINFPCVESVDRDLRRTEGSHGN